MRYNKQFVSMASVCVCFTDITRTPPTFSQQLMNPKWENTGVCHSTWKRDIEIKCWNSLSSKCRTITVIKLADSCLLVSREICKAESVTARACMRVCVEPRCGLRPNKHTLGLMINDACDNNAPYNTSKKYEHMWLINLGVPIKYLHGNVGK